MPLPRSQPPASKGFALVVALSLMAFMVLLILTLSALVQVESQSSELSLKQMEARQNALLGLSVALGQLQKYTGPDQRVTATGELLDAGPGVRHWTGVWGNAANPRDLSAASDPVLLQWLVSGNEGQNFDPLAGVDLSPLGYGQVRDAGDPPTYGSAVTTNGLGPDPDPSGEYFIGGDDAVLLVGKGSVLTNDLPATEAAAVLAPLVEIKANGGSYAWWIGDEGVKARVDLVDPFVNPNPALIAEGYVADAAAKERLSVPQRFAPEMIDGFSSLSPNDPELRKLWELDQLSLIDPALASPVRESFHQLTTASQSVIADSARGGLKKDFTYLAALPIADFKTALDLEAADFNPILPESVMPKASNGPTWEQLHDFVSFEVPTSGIEPRGQTATQHGFHPVLVMAKIWFGVSASPIGAGSWEVIYYIFPNFILANPYDAPIAPTDYTFRLDFSDDTSFIGAWPNATGSGNRSDSASNIGVVKMADIFNDLRFKIELGETMAPGEARVFSIHTDELDDDGRVFRDVDSPQTIRMENDWDLGYAAMAVESGAVVDEAELEFGGKSEDNGIAISVRGGSEVTLNLLDESENELFQRIEGINVVNAMSNARSPYTYLARSVDESSIVLPPSPATLRRIQSGWHFKLMDPGHYPGFAVGYSGVSSGDVRRAIDPQYNWRAPLQARTAHAETFGAMGTDTFVNFAAATWQWYTLNFMNFEGSDLTKPQWAGVIQQRDAQADEFNQFRWQAFHAPRGLQAFASVGSFQHFNAGGHLSGYSFAPATSTNPLWAPRFIAPARAIGNSRANPFVSRDRFQESLSNQPHYDLSYLLNRELLDPFFFTTYPQDSSVAVSDAMRLTNTRLSPVSTDAGLGEVSLFRVPSPPAYQAGDARKAAEALFLDGGFNINSTSKAAWVALLHSLKDTRLNGEEDLTAPFPRSVEVTGGKAVPADLELEDSWNGFRDLSHAEIDALATALVQEIRARGPFLSLADFANRSLSTGADGLAGALQTAIDVAGINSDFPDEVEAWNNEIVPTTPTALPSGLYVDDEHLPKHLFEGAVAWLTQADVFQTLAPVLSARSDTFRIRAYGDVRDPLSDAVSARAWCEAIVQRSPQWVDGTEDAKLDPVSLTRDENHAFGRRYKVIAFRWLNEEDI